MQQKSSNWFEEWFNSPYYDLLYHYRDEEEAFTLMDNIVQHLDTPPNSKMLDLACGKGRHSIFLAEKGYDVTGLDLSDEMVRIAKSYENPNLKFYQHDMREPFDLCGFDYIFNLFTSFGYFDHERDNYKIVHNVANCLKDNGIFVIDFMNVPRVIENLVSFETVYRDDIKFEINRYVDSGFIKKDIRVEDSGELHYYQERVQALQKEDFERYLANANFQIKEVMGSYKMDSYDPVNASRLIIIAQI